MGMQDKERAHIWGLISSTAFMEKVSTLGRIEAPLELELAILTDLETEIRYALKTFAVITRSDSADSQLRETASAVCLKFQELLAGLTKPQG